MGKKIVFDFNGKRKAKKNLQKGIVAGAAIGTLIGTVGGILLAPKSGKETREDIKKSVDTVAKKTTYTIKKTSQKAVQEVKEIGLKIEQEAKKIFNKKPKIENIEGHTEECEACDQAGNNEATVNCDTCASTEDQGVK